MLILLELKSECTHLTLVNYKGPLYLDRLTSIKNFPVEAGGIINDSENKYLPISKYDLKVLVKDIKSSLTKFLKGKLKECKLKILISGVNSSHPNLTKILGESINLPTYLLSPSSNKNFGEIDFVNENIYETNFARLLGLALGISDIKKINAENAIENLTLDYGDYYMPNYVLSKIKYSEETDNTKISIESSNNVISDSKQENIPKKSRGSDKIKNINLNLEDKELNSKKNTSYIEDRESESKLKDSNKKEGIDEKERENFKLDTDFLDLD